MTTYGFFLLFEFAFKKEMIFFQGIRWFVDVDVQGIGEFMKKKKCCVITLLLPEYIGTFFYARIYG